MQTLLESPGVLALIGTLFGASGLKVVEHWLGKAKTKAADQQAMRDELRKEIDGLRAELQHADDAERALRNEVDSWREKYYNLRDEKQKVVTELTIAIERLKMLEPRVDKHE